MFNKKGMDGSYVAIGLFIGLVIGVGIMYWAVSNGVLAGLCPAPVMP